MPSGGGSPGERLIGREAERGLLGDHVARAKDGAKKGVILSGPSGIGKTTLLRWTLDLAQGEGFLCTAVRAPAAGGLPPRFPVGEILEGLMSACGARALDVPHPLKRVVETLRGARDVEPYPAQLPQIAQALEETAQHGPLAIFIDDYQWAAEGADELVAAARLIEVPLLFVITVREESRGAETRWPESSADLWFDHARLGGLSTSDVAQFAKETLSAPLLPSIPDSLMRLTGGNPLFLREILRRWRENSLLVKAGQFLATKDDSSVGAGSTLSDVIRVRLSRVSAEATAVLNVLATFGRPCVFRDLREVCGLPTARLVAALEELESQSLIQSDDHDPGLFGFAHPTHEHVVRDSMSVALKASLHRKVYEKISSQLVLAVGGYAELAHHAAASIEAPSDLNKLLQAAASEALLAGSYKQAARWYALLAKGATGEALVLALEGQAKATAAFDPGTAVELLTRALDLDSAAVHRSHLLAERARALRLLGDFASSLSDIESAAQDAEAQRSIELRHTRAVINGIRGELTLAETELAQLETETRSNPAAHASILGHMGQVSYVKGDLLAARDTWKQALAEAASAADESYVRTNLA